MLVKDFSYKAISLHFKVKDNCITFPFKDKEGFRLPSIACLLPFNGLKKHSFIHMYTHISYSQQCVKKALRRFDHNSFFQTPLSVSYHKERIQIHFAGSKRVWDSLKIFCTLWKISP